MAEKMTDIRSPAGEYEARLEKRFRRDFPVYDFVGLEVLSARDGVYRCYVPYRESNMNHIQTIHAGIQWSAAEVVGGVLIMSLFEGVPVFAVVKDVSIEFKRPAKSAIIAEALFDAARAEQVRSDFDRLGEAEFHLRVLVLSEEGVEIAGADARYLVRKPRGG